ncbi:MCE family protein, partial [Mycolicibacterium sp.]
MTAPALSRTVVGMVIAVTAAALSGCAWQGLNSLPMPGAEGGGPGSYQIQAELPDVTTVQQNSRVRVGDVNVGTVSRIELRGWHALITMTINGDVALPANSTATIGQTSLFGSTHVELEAPAGIAAEGRLLPGAVIPLRSGTTYPTTEQTLAAVSVLLNGGGVGQIQDITRAFSTAFAGREQDLRSLITRLDEFMAGIERQTEDIVAATDSLNRLVGQFADRKPVIDTALRTIPDALAVIRDQRATLVAALDTFGKFSALTADAVNQTKESLVAELKNLAPVLDSLADAGPALTR